MSYGISKSEPFMLNYAHTPTLGPQWLTPSSGIKKKGNMIYMLRKSEIQTETIMDLGKFHLCKILCST